MRIRAYFCSIWSNVHAPANLIGCPLALGRRAEAVALGPRLGALPLPYTLDDAIKLIEGLGLLDFDRPVAERVALLSKGKEMRPILHLYGEIAAANLVPAARRWRACVARSMPTSRRISACSV